MNAPTPEAIAALIEELLRRLCSGGENTSMSTFADIDLSLSQVRMMMVLAYVDAELPISRLAARLDLTLASAGRNVERLLYERLVERNEHPRDRRVKLVRLTPEGRDLVSQHFECHRRMLADFTRRLSDQDRIRISAALTPVLESDLLLDVPSSPPATEPVLTEPAQGK
jgi:DNA-binding MarR family transcriptional regulator